MAGTNEPHSPILPVHRMGLSLVFLAVGCGAVTWPTVAHYVMELQGGGWGLFLAMTLSPVIGMLAVLVANSVLAETFGQRNLMRAGLLGICGCPLLMTYFYGAASVAAGGFVWGFCIGLQYGTANMMVSRAEYVGGRLLMPQLHGIGSAGGLMCSISMVLLVRAWGSPAQSVLVLDICLLGLQLVIERLSPSREDLGPASGLARRTMLPTLLSCVFAGGSYGVVSAWWALFFQDTDGPQTPVDWGGYLIFPSVIFLIRLAGGVLGRRFGLAAVLVAGALCAVCGLCLLLFEDFAWNLAGMVLFGAGISNCLPLLLSSLGCGEDHGRPLEVSRAALSGFVAAWVGMVIGSLSMSYGFELIIGLLVAAMLAVAAMAPKIVVR